jgi:putative phosphoribosyl transferase
MAQASPDHDLLVHVDDVTLKAIHQHPENATGTVIFAHGSGSSRLSTRNQWVAGQLNARGMATLLIDLLTADEAANRDNVFDINLLGRRMIEITRWMIENSPENVGSIGYFGASTGAAAALTAARRTARGDRGGGVARRATGPRANGAAARGFTDAADRRIRRRAGAATQ